METSQNANIHPALHLPYSLPQGYQSLYLIIHLYFMHINVHTHRYFLPYFNLKQCCFFSPNNILCHFSRSVHKVLYSAFLKASVYCGIQHHLTNPRLTGLQVIWFLAWKCYFELLFQNTILHVCGCACETHPISGPAESHGQALVKGMATDMSPSTETVPSPTHCQQALCPHIFFPCE